ncbi:MAG: indole-3-glycerol phosphate synthase TrpC [Deltaproteobacteria bacterium]|nr:indole-3-glycerol phosphate synthase TrpC [Deltaproteobacteria bacterium]
MTILDTILAAKRDEIAASKAGRPWESVDADARAATAVHGSPRGLINALRRPPGAPVRIIAEIKRASPSAGAIRAGADPAAIAVEYETAGAAAISVLTDKQFFDGDLSFLARCRARVGLPLLRKDFLIDTYQVAEARAAGADAILLIVAALTPGQLAELLGAAHVYQLDALVEVHTVKEAEIALGAGAALLGVNHRDLRTLHVDMSLTSVVAPMLPPDVVLVAESGIKTSADVHLLGAVGAHAVLVGEQLMRAASPGEALLALREAP